MTSWGTIQLAIENDFRSGRRNIRQHSIRLYTRPDDHSSPTNDIAPGFKLFKILSYNICRFFVIKMLVNANFQSGWVKKEKSWKRKERTRKIRRKSETQDGGQSREEIRKEKNEDLVQNHIDSQIVSEEMKTGVAIIWRRVDGSSRQVSKLCHPFHFLKWLGLPQSTWLSVHVRRRKGELI